MADTVDVTEPMTDWLVDCTRPNEALHHEIDPAAVELIRSGTAARETGIAQRRQRRLRALERVQEAAAQPGELGSLALDILIMLGLEEDGLEKDADNPA
jgi:hypothetical protein